MGKARAHPDQMGFDFTAPAPCKGVAELAGLERQINTLVGTILASDPRSREVIAAEMSVLLDQHVSRAMLDAYSSPARADHRVPIVMLWALIIVTDRQDLLRPVLAKIGISGLIGDEVKLARVGQLQQTMKDAKAEIKEIEKSTQRIFEKRK